jgi:Flp pilus assembly protein protease CpaA
MELLLVREAIVLIATAAAAYTDFKTGLIYDTITYPLIAAGLLLLIPEFDINALLIAGAVFAIGYALYYAGKIGGGDVKLFAGISLVLPFLNGYSFVLSLVLVSGITALVFISVYYSIKYFRTGIDWKLNKKGIQKSIVIAGAVGAYLFFLYGTGLMQAHYFLALCIPVFFGLVFIAFEKGIKKTVFLKKIAVEELEEDELIAWEFMEKNKSQKIGSGLKGIIDEKTKQKLLGLGIKKVLVYRNLPKFAPFIFIASAIIIFFPEINELLFFWMMV